MKRLITIFLSLMVFGFFLVSCGGGGGGGAFVVTTPKGTFVKNAHTDQSSGWPTLISTSAASIRVQDLYSGTGQIHGSGYITAIGLHADTDVSTAIMCPHVTIKMGHSSLSALTNTFANNVEQGKGTEETVFSDKTVKIPVLSAGDYFTMKLDRPFYFNGVDHLVVDIIRQSACTDDLDLRYDGTVPLNQALFNVDTSATTGSLTFPLNMQFTFKGGVDAVEYSGGLASGAAPFGSTHARIQNLYFPGEINGSGPITGIAFKTAATTTAESYIYTLKLGYSKLVQLNTVFDDNYSGKPVTIITNGSFHIPGNVPAGTYIWIPFPRTFNYNGKDSLIVDLDVSSGTLENDVLYSNVPYPARMAAGPSGSATASSVAAQSLFMAFRFNGGTMDVITSNPSPYIFPVASSNEYIAQILYDGASLGSSGKINKLSFRLAHDSTAAVDNDIRLVLGHTSLSALGTGSLAANIQSDQTTVFDGTITIPAGLKAGDWVTVPFQHPFSYDSRKNLVVQWDSPAITTNNAATGSLALPQFAGHVSANIGNRTSDVATDSGDFVMDMMLNLNQ